MAFKIQKAIDELVKKRIKKDEYDLLSSFLINTGIASSKAMPNLTIKLNGLFSRLDETIKYFFTDIFKPYKGEYQIRNDLLQPLYGLGNILLAAMKVVGLAIATVFFTLLHPIFLLHSFHSNYQIAREKQQGFSYVFKATLVDSLSSVGFLIVGGIKTVEDFSRGVSQILATPIVLLKVFARVGLTVEAGGFTKIEDNPSMHALAEKAANDEDTFTLLVQKFNSAKAKGQPTDIKENPAQANYINNKEDKEKFINLFKKKPTFNPGNTEGQDYQPVPNDENKTQLKISSKLATTPNLSKIFFAKVFLFSGLKIY